jgi:apolipoprotein N-acyltransferase
LVPILVSATLYGLSFPPAGRPLAAWVALAPFCLTVRRVRLRTALVLAWVFAIGSAWAVAYSLPRSVSVYYDQPGVIGFGFLFCLALVTTAPPFMAFAAYYWAIGRRDGSAVPVLAAAAWVACEWLRGRWIGHPWALLGYSQTSVTPLMQVVDVTGVYGLSFLIVIVNTTVAECGLSLRDYARKRRAVWTTIVLAAGCLAAATAYGHLRIHAVAPSLAAADVPVAVVQGNVDLGSQWRPEFYGQNLDVYLRLTVETLRQNRPKLVVWPENSMTFFLQEEPAYQRAIGRILRPSGTQLVAGGPRVTQASRPLYYNAALLVAPAGHILAWYDKERLLPFAEYFPVRKLDLLRRAFGRIREFTPGGPTDPLPSVAGLAGVVICNEAMFPEIVAERVQAGATYLINLTNDGWLNDRKLSDIAFVMAAARAVEYRRYLIRASTSGPSAIVDPLGRIQVRSRPYTRDVISGRIRGFTTTSVYARVGDAFAAVCAAAAFLSLVRAVRRKEARKMPFA